MIHRGRVARSAGAEAARELEHHHRRRQDVEVRDGFAPPPADARVVDLKNQVGRVRGDRGSEGVASKLLTFAAPVKRRTDQDFSAVVEFAISPKPAKKYPCMSARLCDRIAV